VVRKGRQRQWGGEAEQAGEKGRQRRWGGEAEQARRRDSGAVRGSHQIHPQKMSFFKTCDYSDIGGCMCPRQWRSTGRCGGADREATLVGGSAGTCGMAPVPEIQTMEKAARDAECGLGGHEKKRGSQRCHGGRQDPHGLGSGL
jgi:hypothetical protein